MIIIAYSKACFVSGLQKDCYPSVNVSFPEVVPLLEINKNYVQPAVSKNV